MNQRLWNLSKWVFLKEGQPLSYVNPKRRTVILEVNCPDEVQFYCLQDWENLRTNPEKIADKASGRSEADAQRGRSDKELSAGDDAPNVKGSSDRAISFLAVCKGRDRLEFAVDGPFDLFVEGGNAYVYTIDSADIATRIIEPEIFTRIANRRQRNPHLEMIEYQMRLNTQRLQDSLVEEANRRIGAMERKLERYAPQRDQRTPPERVGKARPGDNGKKPVGRSESDNRAAGKAGEKGGENKQRAKVRAPSLDHDEGED